MAGTPSPLSRITVGEPWPEQSRSREAFANSGPREKCFPCCEKRRVGVLFDGQIRKADDQQKHDQPASE
jgi:hypothetical protein